MIHYIFATLAFILLVPLLFLFPVKFTKKGKWVIPIAAFIVSITGIFVYELLTLWHSIILMVLLLLLNAIFLQRQPVFISTSTNEITFTDKEELEKDEYFIIENETDENDLIQEHPGTKRRKLELEELSDQLTEKR